MKCACGCGQNTPVAKKTRGALGHVKGQPVRFVHGHNSLLTAGRVPDSDEAQRGRREARRLYPITDQLCEGCGEVPAYEHHHRDGNPTNNVRENVALLCRRCHMEEDGRMEDTARHLAKARKARWA